jgi:very-short-patch-repair endonuclease
MTTPRELLLRLLEYIKEQAKVINPQGFRLTPSKNFMRRRADVASLSGLEFDLRVAGDHIWLRVPRLAADPPPKLNATYREFLRVSTSPDGPPPALDEAALLLHLSKATKGQGAEEQSQIEASKRNEIQGILTSYSILWSSWAAGEKPRRKTIGLYSDLFVLMHQMEAEETSRPLELIWGIGVSSWALPYEKKEVQFEYPLLTQAVEVHLDEKTMAIELRPRATDTRIELDAFVECNIKGAMEVDRAARQYLQAHKDRPVTPFDLSSYCDILKLMAGNLDSGGKYLEVLGKNESAPPPDNNLVVTDEWVLISRPRAVNYLFEDLRRLQETIQNGCDIPEGPLSLVTPPTDERVIFEPVTFRGISGRGQSHGSGTAEELYFPLPYNDEQVTIVKHLKNAAGVTVQGPPGTGKTHTIANIICHYLATGQRVLVTSRGEAALGVLQAKIPEEVRPLTVALLTSDREGVRQFDASIQAIQHQVSQLNPESTREEIARLQRTIDRTHAELTVVDKRIDEIALTQLSPIEVDGAQMRAQKLAELAISGSEQHGWFDDLIDLSEKHSPPLSEEEAGRLREARRKLGKDIIYVQSMVPSADELPTTTSVLELHDLIVKRNSIQSELDRGTLIPLKANTPDVLASVKDFLDIANSILSVVSELESIGTPWPLALRIRLRQDSFASERKALEALFADLDSLSKARAEFLKRPVVFPEGGFNSPKTLEAVARGAETGKPFGLLSIAVGNAKEQIALVKITGRAPSGSDDWIHVQNFISLNERIRSFAVRWNELAEVLSIPRLKSGFVDLRNTEMIATAARKTHQLVTRDERALLEKANAIFDRVPAAALLGSCAELDSVKQQLVRHLTLVGLARATAELSDLQTKLSNRSGPASDALRTFLRDELGSSDAPRERIAQRYAEIVAEFRRIAALSVELSTVHDSALRIESAGGMNLANRIRSVAISQSGEDTIFPVTWRQAWNWARIRCHLESIEARSELISLAQSRRELEDGLARFYRELVARSSWLATKEKTTPRILAALAGYATAIRKIGAGTGPNATRYRRDARDAMLDAAGAVPCWIMNHSRISEAMPAEVGAFDLVIVDEASQSDLWALPAIIRGKKILVVGDDKQVSPDGGFIAGTRIQELRDRFLSEQPFGAEMTPEKSLYDLAARVFAAEQVMLREHFRCVPPIIAYSNRTFYKDQILPLRIPRVSERIDPPLVDIHVQCGRRDHRDCNTFEAEAIAEEITKILENDKLSRRTIGVVSLLGTEQAKHIDSVVNQLCDASELRRRRFRCGDARTFQGSERDIMFLSLVVDPTDCKAVSGNMFDQRFNVAASRARDRMYLVRSVSTSELSDADLRKTLLSHFDRPLTAGPEQAESLIARCESGFERQIYSELAARGFRVVPQVKSGSYRIDMVVESLTDIRLAIECDGDEFHGPDRWQHDMNRQRILERAGWVFWRCFASTWTLHKEEVLSELIEKLHILGIEPVGALERIPSLVEKRTWNYQGAMGDGAM